MKEIPKYWVTEEGEGTDPAGNRIPLAVWGWSRESLALAAERARDRLRMSVDRLRTGGARPDEYYPRMALREQVLEQLRDDDGMLIAEISRNRYGAEILNTDVVLIADVDFPEPATTPKVQPSGSPSLLARLFGRKQAPTSRDAQTGSDPQDEHERQALRNLGEFAGRHSTYGTHVYRTFGGLRVIVTGSGALPDSDEAADLMAEMNTDEVYVQLCATHGTYRARLTPKPWRIRHRPLGSIWPFRDQGDERWTQRWVDDYNSKSDGRATCRRVGSFGAGSSAVEQRIIDLHDQRSLADSGLPLA